MSWYQWLLVSMFAAEALALVALVGRRGTTITPGGAAAAVVLCGFLIRAVVTL